VPSTLNQVDYKNGQSDEQTEVDESSECVRRDPGQEPKDKQHDKNCPEYAVPISQETRVHRTSAPPTDNPSDLGYDPS